MLSKNKSPRFWESGVNAACLPHLWESGVHGAREKTDYTENRLHRQQITQKTDYTENRLHRQQITQRTDHTAAESHGDKQWGQGAQRGCSAMDTGLWHGHKALPWTQGSARYGTPRCGCARCGCAGSGTLRCGFPRCGSPRCVSAMSTQPHSGLGVALHTETPQGETDMGNLPVSEGNLWAHPKSQESMRFVTWVKWKEKSTWTLARGQFLTIYPLNLLAFTQQLWPVWKRITAKT